jgi:hypothetical protein
MHLATYFLAAILLLAAIGAATESTGVAFVFAVLGVGLIWWVKQRGKNRSSHMTRKTGKGKPRKITDSMIEVPSIGMFGSYTESQNGEYTLVWSDTDPSAGVGGYRPSGHGAYALLHNDTVVCTGKLERPNDGMVANNGTFILSDWCFGGDLKSRLHGFQSDGREILRHEFSANMFNTGLSDTGKYASAQLANSSSEDGGCLALFDLSEGKLLWMKAAETGWADSYRFDDENRRIILVYNKLGSYKYSFDGQLENAHQWEQDRIKHGSGYDLLAVCKAKLYASAGQLNREKANILLEIIDRALKKKEIHGDTKMTAQAFRITGEIHEAAGDFRQAIEKYERATALDSKIGVKRKLEKLKKKYA